VPFERGAAATTFAYDSPSSSLAEALTKPALQYTAPELVAAARPPAQPLSLACDVFSLGCVAFEALTRQPMLTAQTAAEHRAFFASAHLLPMDRVPQGFQARRSPLRAHSCLAPAGPPRCAAPQARAWSEGPVLRRRCCGR